ncbi:hypothetical protein [Candidatus Solirubrobacter pratensis]|uniref:hypothetical protein n=1 Tax=Candidatus Solirubrobacter pratensis TaxID=1298857 RepID=UPI0012DD3710|nr:hypothetical protein [Candidatus Solirubrobacter pratensis]
MDDFLTDEDLAYLRVLVGRDLGREQRKLAAARPGPTLQQFTEEKQQKIEYLEGLRDKLLREQHV